VEERATLVANLNPREQGQTREHREVHKIKRKSSVTSQPNRSGSSATSKYLKPSHMKYDLHIQSCFKQMNNQKNKEKKYPHVFGRELIDLI
jgi:hypothetical protein